MGDSSESSNGPSEQPVLVLAGPTAVGKSEVALWLAERLGGEIISADSMQVYRGLDIGTAKPSSAERERVPHYLIDVLELTQAFDAAQFVAMAREAAAAIQARKRLPILCGGTGLYIKAFLEGLGASPPGDQALRAELEKTPLPVLLNELAEHDSVTYERIDRKNARRVIRAIEVIRLTGKPYSQARTPWKPAAALPWAFGLMREKADLRRRIDMRVEAMFRAGMVSETEGLLQRGLEQNRTAMQALGYRQVVEYLRGQRSLAQTIELVKIRTHQFAKRQMTWFRQQLRLNWVHVGVEEPARVVAERLVEFSRARHGAANLKAQVLATASPPERGLSVRSSPGTFDRCNDFHVAV